jgi:hypothetical protein
MQFEPRYFRYGRNNILIEKEIILVSKRQLTIKMKRQYLQFHGSLTIDKVLCFPLN